MPAAGPRSEEGAEWEVFYRFAHSPPGGLGADGWFPVAGGAQGTHMPRAGWTDGWLPARQVGEYDEAAADAFDPATWLQAEVLCPLWATRRGELRRGPLRCRFPPPHARPRAQGAPHPRVSFLCVRWGGKGGPPDEWVGARCAEQGVLTTSVCDGFIDGLYETAAARLGPSYEVYTVFASCGADLARVCAPSAAARLGAQNRCGLYFLWPALWRAEGAETPAAGHAHAVSLFDLMRRAEHAGVRTCFPHPVPLYRTLVDKTWCATTQCCAELRVPLTVQVPREVHSAGGAAAAARCALHALAAVSGGAPPERGVAKLGYSWESVDVRHWKGEAQLAERMDELLLQPGCDAEQVIVQEFVPSDAELRVYLLGGRAAHCIWTRFAGVGDKGEPADFERTGKDDAVDAWLGGDKAAAADAERRWARWARGVCALEQPLLRVDFFVRRISEGRCSVTTGELTEAGACTLGWEGGRAASMAALMSACAAGPASAEHGEYSSKRPRLDVSQ
eukprot:TRINITY_DN17256_c2_g1_i1.p1 TRINITY_DN17256_c2_g1~~TRINITY_DN17256_c2_g1_i1.p1  ORF type:complete len:533 (+),score=105.40 TRINITY_DN17256_c2_g1_i1:86-1600(+)